MPHQTVEAVESMHAVMDRVQPPEPTHTMTPIVNYCHAESGNNDRKEQLHAEGQSRRPDASPREKHCHKWQHQDRVDIRDLIDYAVSHILTDVRVCVVPGLLKG